MLSKTLAIFCLCICLMPLSAQAERLRLCTLFLNHDRELGELQKELTVQKDAATGLDIELHNFPVGRTDVSEYIQRELVDKGVQCDGLVFSGHHSGSWWGKQSEDRLSIDELEEISCSEKGAEWFSNVNMVWFQGCNTLSRDGTSAPSCGGNVAHHTARIHGHHAEQSVEELQGDLENLLSANRTITQRYRLAFPNASTFGWDGIAPGEKSGSEHILPRHFALTSNLLHSGKNTASYRSETLGAALKGQCHGESCKTWVELGQQMRNPIAAAHKPAKSDDRLSSTAAANKLRCDLLAAESAQQQQNAVKQFLENASDEDLGASLDVISAVAEGMDPNSLELQKLQKTIAAHNGGSIKNIVAEVIAANNGQDDVLELKLLKQLRVLTGSGNEIAERKATDRIKAKIADPNRKDAEKKVLLGVLTNFGLLNKHNVGDFVDAYPKTLEHVSEALRTSPPGIGGSNGQQQLSKALVEESIKRGDDESLHSMIWSLNVKSDELDPTGEQRLRLLKSGKLNEEDVNYVFNTFDDINSNPTVRKNFLAEVDKLLANPQTDKSHLGGVTAALLQDPEANQDRLEKVFGHPNFGGKALVESVNSLAASREIPASTLNGILGNLSNLNSEELATVSHEFGYSLLDTPNPSAVAGKLGGEAAKILAKNGNKEHAKQVVRNALRHIEEAEHKDEWSPVLLQQVSDPNTTLGKAFSDDTEIQTSLLRTIASAEHTPSEARDLLVATTNNSSDATIEETAGTITRAIRNLGTESFSDQEALKKALQRIASANGVRSMFKDRAKELLAGMDQ